MPGPRLLKIFPGYRYYSQAQQCTPLIPALGRGRGSVRVRRITMSLSLAWSRESSRPGTQWDPASKKKYILCYGFSYCDFFKGENKTILLSGENEYIRIRKSYLARRDTPWRWYSPFRRVHPSFFSMMLNSCQHNVLRRRVFVACMAKLSWAKTSMDGNNRTTNHWDGPVAVYNPSLSRVLKEMLHALITGNAFHINSQHKEI